MRECNATSGGTNMKILITGANGFVGNSICAELQRQGYEVRGAVRRSDVILNSKISRVTVGEINSQTDWSSALADVDVVIHLAARVHVMKETSISPLDAFRITNVHGTEQLARSAAAHGVKRLVFVNHWPINGAALAGIPSKSPAHWFAIPPWSCSTKRPAHPRCSCRRRCCSC